MYLYYFVYPLLPKLFSDTLKVSKYLNYAHKKVKGNLVIFVLLVIFFHLFHPYHYLYKIHSNYLFFFHVHNI